MLQKFYHRSYLCLVLLFLFLSASAQNVSYSPLYDADAFQTRTLSQTLPVGSTGAQGGVSVNGGATYSIPIVVPPGTNGIVPALSIEYNSQAGPGIAGMGWSISGLSVIARVPNNTYFEGKANPVELTSNDRFALDGRRLILKTGTYGAANAKYGTEVEDFAVVTSLGSEGGGPKSFEVLTKDGVLMEFGNTSDSRFLSETGGVVMFWRLNKIRYPDGNYISYEYSTTTSERDSRLVNIKYTGNDTPNNTLAPYNVIEFSYKIRQEVSPGTFSDIRTSYEAGSTILSKYLLDVVTVKAEGAVSKKYEFSYGHDNINSYLKSVTESGSDGSKLNPTIFKYGDAPESFTLATDPNLNGGTIDYFSGDFDGNGKSDIVLATYTGGGYFLPELFPKKYTSFKIARDGNPNNVSSSISLNDGAQMPNRQMADYSLNLGDYNGDGLDDILTAQIGETTISGTKTMLFKGVAIFRSKLGTSGQQSETLGFSPIGFALLPDENIMPAKANYVFSGDFDGDGKHEVITISKRAAAVGGNHKAYFLKFYETDFDAFTIVRDTDNAWIGDNWASADKIHILDFNGDGKDDVMTTEGSNCKIYTLAGPHQAGNLPFKVIYSSSNVISGQDAAIFSGDFNMDGKTDILFQKFAGGDESLRPWKLGISTGKDFVVSDFTFLAPRVSAVGNDIIRVADFNGDGRTDIFHQYTGAPSNQTVNVYYSTGNKFYTQQYAHSSLRNADKPGITCDLNGDGRTEVLYFNSTGSYTIISPKKSGKENLLQKVQTGIGHTTEWAYKSLSDGADYYVKGAVTLTDYPLTRIQVPLLAVSDYKLPDGIGGSSIIKYSYEGARLHRAGKGFLGFTKVTSSNMTMGTKDITENEFNNVYYVALPKTTSSSLLDNTAISSSVQSNTLVPAGTNRFWVKTTNVTESNTLEGKTVTTDRLYDDYGNVIKSTVNNNSVETTITDTEYGAYITGIPNRPTLVTATRTRTGNTGSYIVKTKMDYTLIGQLQTKTEFFGRPKKLVSSYEYHRWGSLKKTTVTGYDGETVLPERTNTLETYDDYERYPKTVKNELSQVSSFTYDFKWGKPLTVTGINGLVSTLAYDAFGRLTTTTNPGTNTLTQTYEWSIADGAVWKSKSTYSVPANLPTQGRPETIAYFDILGRQVKFSKKGFGGNDIIQTQTYDNKGNPKTATDPHKPSETIYNSTTNYYDDPYNRLTSINKGGVGLTSFSYSYTNGLLTVETTPPSTSAKSSKTTDAAGKLVSATDGGGTLTYSYYNHGGLNEVKKDNVVVTKSEYDEYGRQNKLTDSNAGMLTYVYDAFGQLVSQVNANGNTTTMLYNQLGQMTSRTGVEGITSYEYCTTNTGGESKGEIKKVTGFENNETRYVYDTSGRLSSLTEKRDGSDYTTSYTYNNFGDVISMTYPSGFVINNEYDSYGYLKKIKRGQTLIYETTGTDNLGQVTGYETGNNKSSSIVYTNGFPTAYTTAGVQNYQLDWDYPRGLLKSRKDARTAVNKIETFLYDDLGRLTKTTVGAKEVEMRYTTNGNIEFKKGIEDYSYHPSKVNAATGVNNPQSAISSLPQAVSYNAFNQPERITENDYILTYDYGADYTRIKSELTQGTSTKYVRNYFEAGFERQVIGTTVKFLQYIWSPAGLVAIAVSEAGDHTMHFTYTDHLGSILTVTKEDGTIEAEQSFDAWGRRRNPVSWDVLASTETPTLPDWLIRGYTGHEQLDQFGLINMNGRLYDPVIGRMLSADNFVTEVGSTQGYNRYTYANNNPLLYNDPNGQTAFIFGMVASQFIGTTAGIIIGGISAYYVAKNNGATQNQAILAGFGGAIVGGAIGYGIGSINYGGLFSSSAAAHPLTQAATEVASHTPSVYGPIFDVANGEFLGKTVNSFQGGILFMSQSNFAKIVTASVNGLPSQEAALKYGKPMYDPKTQADVDIVNRVLDYVAKQTRVYMYGIDPSSFSKMHNGMVSSYTYLGASTTKFDSPSIVFNSNGGEYLRDDHIAQVTSGNIITFNVFNASTLLNTVENIQNVFIHEFVGHYTMKIPGGGKLTDHFKAMELQRAHPTWKNTTPYFKWRHPYEDWKSYRSKHGL